MDWSKQQLIIDFVWHLLIIDREKLLPQLVGKTATNNVRKVITKISKEDNNSK